MMTIEEIQKKINLHKNELIIKYKIKSIGIFGSFSRNEASEISDIDILVDFDEPIGLDFVTLANELEDLLGRKVDLVSANAVKPEMKKYVDEDLIYV